MRPTKQSSFLRLGMFVDWIGKEATVYRTSSSSGARPAGLRDRASMLIMTKWIVAGVASGLDLRCAAPRRSGMTFGEFSGLGGGKQAVELRTQDAEFAGFHGGICSRVGFSISLSDLLCK